MNPWLDELWRAMALALVSLVVGAVAGHVLLALLLTSVAYLGWHLRSLYRLDRWLRHGKRFHPPDASGIWAEVFQQIYRLQQRNRKRKRKLGTMLNRFQEATAALPDATVVLGANEEIEWWNAAAEDVFGLHYPRDVGQRISNLARHPAFAEFMHRGEYTEPVQFPSPVSDRITLSARIIPYGKNQRLLVARDITRVQRLEQMRRDFVANVSHELRTPLTVVSGYLEALEDEAREDIPQWEATVRTMREQTTRMQRIVEELLLLSRLETGQQSESPEPLDVPSMLAEIRDDAAHLSGEQGHVVTLDADPDLWLRGNEAQLRSAFSNLVYNAVRYTPAGGRIAIRWYADDGGAHCAVRDTGIGIAVHHIPRLTERFYRVDVGRSRRSGGTGLGLAIVKHVLLRHDASLHIDSEPGQGSEFRCDFPAERVVRQTVTA